MLLIFKNKYLANDDHAYASAMMRRKSPLSIADWGLQTGPKCSEMLQPLAKASVLGREHVAGRCDGVARGGARCPSGASLRR